MATDRRTLLAWAGTLLLLVLCLTPKGFLPWGNEDLPRKVPHLDKLVHLAMFAGVCWLWTRAGRGPSRLKAVKVLAFASALAVGTELLQGLPRIDRDPDALDALADVVGAIAGVGLAVVVAGVAGETPIAGDLSEG